MAALSIRELNANISKVIARVEAGETIDIARNGKVVAELRPKRRHRPDDWWEAWRQTEALLERGLPLGVGTLGEDDKYGDAPL
ncbi:MAG: type II toxin-antitoxin system Phd/YefM family antitoxin [Allosphingosinicella sp.]|uniref:type II toxin-antitoxin system Phd/YefM family antitoxin n=1 Tax=Allosphingosinicella sp. TaxID=2823234 RepID=UPI0039581CC1